MAQINPEPSGIKSWDKSIKLDIFYVDNVSFFLDFKILFKTALLLLLLKKPSSDFKKLYELKNSNYWSWRTW